jgi:hypothetical protein
MSNPRAGSIGTMYTSDIIRVLSLYYGSGGVELLLATILIDGHGGGR